MPPPVLVVSERGVRGGAETSTVLLAESLVARGLATRLAFCFGGPLVDEARARGVRVLPGTGDKATDRYRLRLVTPAATMGARRVQLVHVSSLEGRCEAVGRIATRLRLPTVGHVRLPRQVEAAGRLHERGAAIVTNSSATEASLRAQGADRVRFVANGIDVDRFVVPVDRGGTRAELGVPVDAPLAVVVANLNPYKGVDALVPGLAAAMEVCPELHVVHVGGIPYDSNRPVYDRVVAAIAEHGIGDRVHLVGSRSDIARLTGAADLAIVPSRGEGTARVVLEAWCYSLPVVAADVDGVNDLVVHDRNGLLVDLDDPGAVGAAVAAVAGDGALARRLGEQGRADLDERYTHEHHVDGILAVYEELLGVGGAPA